MSDSPAYSPEPWEWTEFGVLSDGNGDAIMDCENWALAPENAVLISATPSLLKCLERTVDKYKHLIREEDDREIREVLSRATTVGRLAT